MKFIVMTWSQSVGGATSVFGPIGEYLEATLVNDYGAEVDCVKLEPCVPVVKGTPSPKDRGIFGELPKVTFRRKRNLIRIRFLSSFAEAKDLESTEIRTELCNRACGDFLQALLLIRDQIKRFDDFDVDRFLTDSSDVLSVSFSTVEEIQQKANAVKASRALQSPWASLDLDWDLEKYHRDARSLLDAPIFWSRGDPYAPHGSDTGSDVLDMFYQDVVLSKDTTAERYAKLLIENWNLSAHDWDTTDKISSRAQFEEDSYRYSIRNRIVIAVAFASIKFMAECSHALAQQALRGIHREHLKAEFGRSTPLPRDHYQALMACEESLQRHFCS